MWGRYLPAASPAVAGFEAPSVSVWAVEGVTVEEAGSCCVAVTGFCVRSAGELVDFSLISPVRAIRPLASSCVSHTADARSLTAPIDRSTTAPRSPSSPFSTAISGATSSS